MKKHRVFLYLCAVSAALFVLPNTPQTLPSSARILIVIQQEAAPDEEFMKRSEACEAFTRQYFGRYAALEKITLPSPSSDTVFEAAAKMKTRWALAFSLDDGDCVYRAYDCEKRIMLSYENETENEVDLERGDKIDLWTGKDMYALLYRHVLSENKFFLPDAQTPSETETRLVVANFINDEKSKSDFPQLSSSLAAAIAKENAAIKTLYDANAHFPADFYRFINSADEIKPMAKIWNARWYLGGTIFKEKGNYKIFINLMDCIGGNNSVICDTAFQSEDDLKAIISRSAEKISILAAAGGSGSALANKSVAMLYEYSKSGQYPVYSFCASPKGDIYLSTMMSVLHFSADGKLLGELASYGSGPGEFQTIYKIRTDARGDVYLLDYAAGRVLKYGSDDSFKKEIRTGAGYPMSMAVSDDGEIAVSETGKNQVYILSEPYIEPKIVTAGDLSYVSGLYFYGGEFYAWSTEGTAGIQTVKIKRSGDAEKDVFIGIPNFFSGQIDRDRSGNFYAVEQNARYLLKTDRKGNVLWLNKTINGMQGSLGMANDLTVSGDGTVFISDMINRRGVAVKEVEGFTPLSGAAEYLKRAKSNRDAKSDRYMADIQCAVRGGSGEAAEILSDIYAQKGYFDPALALLEKRLHSAESKQQISKKIEDLQFNSHVFNAEILKSRIDRVMKNAGVESARPLYAEAVKSYELALKMRPQDAGLRNRYESLCAIFERSPAQSAPKIDVADISTVPVFAALYKFYNENDLGSLTLRNTTGKTIDSVFAKIEVKGYMDYPTESRTHRGISDGSEQKIKLFAVFNNNILNLTEDTPLSAQVSVVYRIDGKEYISVKNISLSVYNRNALIWDDASKLSSFITPKDPVVSVFSRETLTRFRNSRFTFINSNLLSAMQIFDSLGVYGITYVKDPKTPFAVFSKNRTQVDFIQYPRDTLRFKTGDCDDLTVMTSSLLENVGIETATVTVPGHIFLIFNTGVPEANAAEIAQDANQTIRHNGTVWIPIETTMIGKPFMQAWEESAKTYSKYISTKDLAITSIHEGWEKYAPVTLNESQWSPAAPDAGMSEKMFFDDMNTLIERELKQKIGMQKEKSAANPENPAPFNSMGVAYARYGKYREAEDCFRKAGEIQPNYAASWQNLGNLFLLQEKFQQAEEYYRRAGELSPSNANIYINLAILYDKMNRRPDLAKAYAKAVSIDGRLEKQYAYLVKKDDGQKASGTEKTNVLWEE